jgi:hypothetical protein
MKDNGRNGFFDCINNVMELVVEKGDFYRTGEIAPSSFGPFIIDGRFCLND